MRNFQCAGQGLVKGLSPLPLQCAGGTMETVIEEVLNRGGSESFTKVISVVAAPEALRRLSPNYPSTL